MGSYDRAESCELVGTFLLHKIKEKHGNNFSLYRDDSLSVTTAPPRQVELIKKDLFTIFSKHSLRITNEANNKIVNFLNVTLNLINGKYMPYTKPNIPLYINKKSNHPLQIIKNVPNSINNRLSEISYDEESFNKAAPLYQKALDDSGHKHCLEFHPPSVADPPNSNRKNRHRDIIWYNPPYSKNVATNVGRAFLKILDKEFPKGHVLLKIFNRNTIKISYSYMSNVKQTLNSHNKSSLLKKNTPPPRTCNCRKLADCPMAGNCLKESVVYQATVITEDHKPDQISVGLTEHSFKTRFTNHKASFTDPSKRFNTELSKHIWQLKDTKTDFRISWKILKHATPYNPASNRCNLCLWEKYFIICRPDLSTLNKENELITSCRHANKFLLKNVFFYSKFMPTLH